MLPSVLYKPDQTRNEWTDIERVLFCPKASSCTGVELFDSFSFEASLSGFCTGQVQEKEWVFVLGKSSAGFPQGETKGQRLNRWPAHCFIVELGKRVLFTPSQS